jgi:hypothetical protein
MIQQFATRLWDGYIYPALKKLIVRALAKTSYWCETSAPARGTSVMKFNKNPWNLHRCLE